MKSWTRLVSIESTLAAAFHPAAAGDATVRSPAAPRPASRRLRRHRREDVRHPPSTAPALALLLLLPSCIVAAVAAGAAAVYGVVKYHQNEASMDFRAGVPAVFDAALRTMQEQGYVVNLEQKPSTIDGTIESGETKVRVERQEGGFTRVRVRIGTFDTDDHRRRAGLLLEGIRKRLGE
jgi:hypothetical protein